MNHTLSAFDGAGLDATQARVAAAAEAAVAEAAATLAAEAGAAVSVARTSDPLTRLLVLAPEARAREFGRRGLPERPRLQPLLLSARRLLPARLAHHLTQALARLQRNRL